jgi:hypothetical protein
MNYHVARIKRLQRGEKLKEGCTLDGPPTQPNARTVWTVHRGISGGEDVRHIRVRCHVAKAMPSYPCQRLSFPNNRSIFAKFPSFSTPSS